MKNKIQLEPKHLVWIFDSAGQHFTDEIARLESELVRHESIITTENKDDVLISISSVQKTRQDRIDEIKRFITEYQAIVCFCREMKLRGIDLSAQQFAKEFSFIFKK